jgi:signal transduction histidine kinase
VKLAVAEGIEVTGDPELIAILIENLLGNAYKFTRNNADARIEFGAIDEGGRRVCFIRDNVSVSTCSTRTSSLVLFSGSIVEQTSRAPASVLPQSHALSIAMEG